MNNHFYRFPCPKLEVPLWKRHQNRAKSWTQQRQIIHRPLQVEMQLLSQDFRRISSKRAAEPGAPWCWNFNIYLQQIRNLGNCNSHPIFAGKGWKKDSGSFKFQLYRSNMFQFATSWKHLQFTLENLEISRSTGWKLGYQWLHSSFLLYETIHTLVKIWKSE